MDTEKQIFFYEHDYYVFSNFSAFRLYWKGLDYMTSEHAYHAERFSDEKMKEEIRGMRSAHDAYKYAQENKHLQIENWNDIKLGVMKEILKEKVEQHPYVKKKLIDSGERELIEDSWRDGFWGWGPNKDGENHLGKLWMEIRREIKEKL